MLQAARMPLEEYAEAHGREIGARAARIEQAARRAGAPLGTVQLMALPDPDEAIRLRERATELSEEVDAAYERGSVARAERLQGELAVVLRRLNALGEVLEEGGEEEREIGEYTVGDEFEDALATGYYNATLHPFYSQDPTHATGANLRDVVRYYTERRVTRAHALEMGRRAWEARQARLTRMRATMEAGAGRVPEHVRVEHSLALLRAARVPPELAEALGYQPLRPNPGRLHPVVDATLEALRAGESPTWALNIPLSAGLSLVVSRRVVRECETWIEHVYSS